MRFNSLEYGLFFATVLAVYYLINPRFRGHLLFVASVIFYMSWKAEYIFLILGTLSLCYLCIWQMAKRESTRKLWLALCLFLSLVPLVYFKYSNFILSNMPSFLDNIITHNLSEKRFDVILPLGISFYTFQLLSYAIDVYREKAALEKYSLFMLYVLFFPQLIAGPIVRCQVLMPQLKSGSCEADSDQFDAGIALILFGLLKKVVIADYLASIIDPYFAGVSSIPKGGWDCLLLLYAFSFQIYFDFGGYTDIARGSAKMLGIELPINFNFPYVAKNLREFWRRWHITLSTWLRDYLYISLGGSRGGKYRLYVNLFITMVLGGLWHGASWTFVSWGAFHGIILMITRFYQELRQGSKGEVAEKRNGFLAGTICMILTYNLACLGWLLFRAPTLRYVYAYVAEIFHFTSGYFDSSLPPFLGILLFCLFFGQWLIHAIKDKIALPRYRPARAIAFAALILVITLFAQRSMSFIYFQF